MHRNHDGQRGEDESYSGSYYSPNTESGEVLQELLAGGESGTDNGGEIRES